MSPSSKETSSKPALVLVCRAPGAGAAASASERSETGICNAGRRRIVNAAAAAKPVEPVLEPRPAMVGTSTPGRITGQ